MACGSGRGRLAEDADHRSRLPSCKHFQCNGGRLERAHRLRGVLGIRLLKTFARNRFRYWPLSLVCTLFLVSATTSQAESYSEPEFYSLKDWAPIHTWEYVAIPAMNAATLTIIATIHPPPRWRGGILFDNWARGGLTLKSEAAQTHAGNVSTVLTVSLGGFPVLLDAGLLTWWVHEPRQLALHVIVLAPAVVAL